MSNYYGMSYEEIEDDTRWIDEGIKKGDPAAMRAQAVLCRRFQNETGASYWIEQAELAEQGLWKPDPDDSLPPLERLRAMYSRLEEKAKQGDAEAMLSLYHLFKGTARREEGICWLEKAAGGGSEKAQRELETLREKIREEEKERKENQRLNARMTAEKIAKIPKLKWENTNAIAILLDDKFPHADVPSLSGEKLLDMMREADILRKLPEIDEDERKDRLSAIKSALLQYIH